MKLTDKQLGDYVSAKLALSGDERNEHRNQVGRLLEKLEARSTPRTAPTGSRSSAAPARSRRARATAPARASRSTPTSASTSTPTPTTSTSPHLQRLIKQLLAAAYPQKSPDDFDDSGARTFGVVFKGIGLEVDLVPIVALDDDADYGYSTRAPVTA